MLASCLSNFDNDGENIRDQVVAVLVLLQATECHLCAGNILLWILKILELNHMLLLCEAVWVGRLPLTRVPVFHSIPLALFASVYEYPSTEPV